MKIALLFGLFPEEFYAEILNNSKGGIQYAADALQKSFMEGIGSLSEGTELINVPYIGSYPQRYTNLHAPQGIVQYRTKNGHIVGGQTLYFCNLKGYKMYDSYRVARNALLDWVGKNNNEERVVMVYAIYAPFLKAVVEIKKKYSDIKVLLIVPDLPEFMSQRETSLKKFVKLFRQVFFQKCYEYVDYYVLLSRYMIERLPIGNKPWTVIEGIFNVERDDVQVLKKETGTKTVFYSGTLARRYGIMNLVQAFMMIENPTYRLMICGNGDTKEEIMSLAKVDKRIIYKGQLPRHEILVLQRQVNLLVNPRTPEGEFTKYSFPSKTMEYLASGTPTLLYRLPGIPDEYFNYCFVVDGLGIKALQVKIEEVLNLSHEDLELTGKRARDFILKQKNPIQQCKKIFQLIQK